jgi:hypothetical protein
MGGDTTREELAQFLFHEPRHVPAILLLTRKERLQVARQNLIKHRLFGLARAIGLSLATNAGTRETPLRQTLHETTASACRLPFAGSFQPRTYGRRPLKDRGKHDNLFRVFRRQILQQRSVLANGGLVARSVSSGPVRVVRSSNRLMAEDKFSYCEDLKLHFSQDCIVTVSRS